MSYDSEKNNFSRKIITLIEITMDYCANSFGVSPCTSIYFHPCYNTFFSCTDKPHFIRTTKIYRFVNRNASNSVIQMLNARPYFINPLDYMGTEIRDDKTITARFTINLADEPDYDDDTDPYLASRTNLLDVKGSYWKKWLERNPFYKGRRIVIKEGFEGNSENDFVIKAAGNITNITRDGKSLKIECTDDIADLSQVKYPYKTNIKTAQDLGACFACKTRDDMLKLSAVQGDFALRKDFEPFTPLVYPGSSGTINSMRTYLVIGYTAQGNPYACSDITIFMGDGITKKEVTLTFPGLNNLAYWKIWMATALETEFVNYLVTETEILSFTDNGSIAYPNVGSPDTEANRLYQLTAADPTDENNWALQDSPLLLQLDSVTDLDAQGYIKIEDEILFYNSIADLVLTGVRRLEFNTKADTAHYSGTTIRLVEWENPSNPFTLLHKRLTRAGLDDSRIDLTTINALRDAWTGINFSTKPIVKDTDAAKLIFDLCWTLDYDLWVNEQGLITVKDSSSDTIEYSVNDSENIILDSESIDFNQDEIKTRISLSWDIYDPTKGNDKTNYTGTYVEIDRDAESEAMYNDVFLLEQLTYWINLDCGAREDIAAHIKSILNKKINRFRLPRPKLSFDVEIKDNDIKTGTIIGLSGDAVNDIYGYDYQDKKAKVLKREPKGNKITLTVKILPDETVTTVSEDGSLIIENPKPIRFFDLNEVRVTGLKMIDQNGEHAGSNLDISIINLIKLQFDNMYASESETATDITGATRALPKMINLTIGEIETDTNSWSTTKKYNVYMGVMNPGHKYPVTSRPTLDDANCKWYLIGSIPDLKSYDQTKKYNFTKIFPITWTGRYVCFDIYADAKIVYDPNALVAIEVEKLQ